MPVGEDSVKVVCVRINEIIEESRDVMREYKKEIDLYRQEIALMENHLSTANDENVKLVNPHIVANFEDLSASVVK